MNGYDKYLEYQYRMTGDFYNALFLAISLADGQNLKTIEKGFPSEVEAFKSWTRTGVEDFVQHVSPDHMLMDKFRKEYNLPEESEDNK